MQRCSVALIFSSACLETRPQVLEVIAINHSNMLQISVYMAIQRERIRYYHVDTIILGHILIICGYNFKRL